MNYKLVASVFIILTVVLGGAVGYLLAYPGGGNGSGYTYTKTVVSTSVSTVMSGSVSTLVITSTETTTATGAGSGGYSVGIAYKPGIGYYLADGSGMTLYYRTKDIQSNGTSTCTGGCIQAWPVFYTAKLVLAPGLNASSFNTVLRGDGKQQLTYDGWPLYYFAEDNKPGDTLGQGIGGIWFARPLLDPSPPATSTTTSTSISTTSSSATSSVTSAVTSTSTTSTTTAESTTSTSSTSTTTSSTSSSSYGYW